MKTSVLTRLALSAAIVSASLSAAVAQTGNVVLDPNLPYQDVTTTLRDLDENFLRDGVFVTVDKLDSIKLGMTPQQIQALLGAPVTEERTGQTLQWEYNLELPISEQGKDMLVCQFRVVFENDHVTQAAWRRKQCKILADSQPRDIDLASDFLFGFDQFELSAQGQATLDTLAENILALNRPVSIVVIGHTDHLGSRAYNQTLSERRARSVAEHLVDRGVPAIAIRTMGAGAMQPVVQCEGVTPTPELKACLAPNRRVSIQVR